MRLTWASLALALVLVTGHEGDGEYAEDLCKDRNDRWSAYGTSCDRVKAMCEDDFYGDLVRSWCPVTCGSCQAHRSFPFQVQSNAILRRSANHEDNATGDNASNATEATKTCGSATCGGATGEGLEGLPDRGSEPAEFIETKELEKKTESAGFNRSLLLTLASASKASYASSAGTPSLTCTVKAWVRRCWPTFRGLGLPITPTSMRRAFYLWNPRGVQHCTGSRIRQRRTSRT
ncbi:unnamed protein product [Symbiodinium pilosum]|uniref:ShKT domain-containing protein n=1 Tax=Symbiodinium pilosum TaxID=2952 RepID=A0A812M718_SYMPI|nr:unnamed protein product [Symbiodinium pilosum]